MRHPRDATWATPPHAACSPANTARVDRPPALKHSRSAPPQCRLLVIAQSGRNRCPNAESESRSVRRTRPSADQADRGREVESWPRVRPALRLPDRNLRCDRQIGELGLPVGEHGPIFGVGPGRVQNLSVDHNTGGEHSSSPRSLDDVFDAVRQDGKEDRGSWCGSPSPAVVASLG